jgi:hypothetical protein
MSATSWPILAALRRGDAQKAIAQVTSGFHRLSAWRWTVHHFEVGRSGVATHGHQRLVLRRRKRSARQIFYADFIKILEPTRPLSGQRRRRACQLASALTVGVRGQWRQCRPRHDRPDAVADDHRELRAAWRRPGAGPTGAAPTNRSWTRPARPGSGAPDAAFRSDAAARRRPDPREVDLGRGDAASAPAAATWRNNRNDRRTNVACWRHWSAAGRGNIGAPPSTPP